MDQQKFVVEVLRQAFVDAKPGMCELNFLLVLAVSSEEAGAKAEAFSRSQEWEFENPVGQHVVWKFMRLIGVDPVISDEANDVIEIHMHVFQDLASFEQAQKLIGFPVED